MGAVVRYRLLGAVDVRRDDVTVAITAGKQRVVLAALLVNANRVVTVGDLVRYLWSDSPPATARTSLQNYVMRLRRSLGGAEQSSPLSTVQGGYLIEVGTEELDLLQFKELVDQADLAMSTAGARRASALLRDALAIWRGDPLADVPSADLHREVVPGLHEKWLHATELRMEAELQLGRHDGVIAELRGLTTRHPHRAGFWAQLMLALYRSGRQADALDAYRKMRGIFADELGLDPSVELRELHQAILTDAPDLGVRATGQFAEIGFRPPVPRQLPAPSRLFTGRIRELRQLDAALGAEIAAAGQARTAAVGGVGGVGKTWLALRWAHDNAHLFPDGQLYVNLHGFDPSRTPVSSTVAVRGFLDALGVDPRNVPVQPDAQAALYRSLLAERQMLVIVDNAVDSAQVAPLLPGGSSAAVVVTSRWQLGDLVATQGAVPITLDVLDESEARAFLNTSLGAARAAAEPAAVAELLAYCAGLPLALGIVAALATARPSFPLAALVADLSDVETRLDSLKAGELTANLRTVFACSYHSLDEQAATMFALLGLTQGPDIGVEAVASLAGRSVASTRDLLRTLEAAHLVAQRVPGRYRMHDLVRLYANEQSRRRLDASTKAASLRRLVDFYLHTASAGRALLDPLAAPIALGEPSAGTLVKPLPDAVAALSWFHREHPYLLAAQQVAAEHGWDTAVWQLAWSIGSFYKRRCYLRELRATWQLALEATQRLKTPADEATVRLGLGNTLMRLGDYEAAHDHLRRTLAIHEDGADPAARAHAHRQLGMLFEATGELDRALAHANLALTAYRALGEPLWQAQVLNAIGWYHALLGQYDLGRPLCTRALTLFRWHGNRPGEADTLDSLAYMSYHEGKLHQALEYYERSIELLDGLDNQYAKADGLAGLGEVQQALGEHGLAEKSWREALALYESQHRQPEAARIRPLLVDIIGPGD